MLVGTKRIDHTELREAIDTRHTIEMYITRLIPTCLQHLPAVKDNQRYLVALHIRRLTGVNFTHKMNIANELVEGVTVQGSINNVYDIEDILTHVNFDKLLRALFDDELTLISTSGKRGD